VLLLLLRLRVVWDIPALDDSGFLTLFAQFVLVIKVDDVADGVHSEVFEDEKFFRLLVAFFFFDAVVPGIVTWEGVNSIILMLVHHSSPCSMC